MACLACFKYKVTCTKVRQAVSLQKHQVRKGRKAGGRSEVEVEETGEKC